MARRRVVGVVALGVAVLVAAGLAVPVARGVLEDGPAAPATPGGGGPWERLARPPANDVFPGPDPPSVTWTGRELILLGAGAYLPPHGDRPARGLAYDPGRDRWRRLAAPPPGLIPENPPEPAPVWTGAEVLAWGAAYDPAADTWGPVPGPPGGAAWPDATGVWTGAELIVWSATSDQTGRSVANTASAYDPATGRRRRLPPAPIVPRRLAGVVWAGDRLLVWGGLRNLPHDRLAYPEDGAAYDPRGNRWQRLARAPIPSRAAPLAAWTGDWAVFIGGANLGDRLSLDQGNLPAITGQGAAWRPR